MSIGGLPLMETLKTRMAWHNARQKVLAENVANADMPGYRPLDVRAPDPARPGVPIARTSAAHLVAAGGSPLEAGKAQRFETTPSGNGVNLEDEMMKVAQNAQDYQFVASLYQKSLGLMKIAIGRGR
jgi:flagellar basal-body rod protein FlgB